MSGNKETVTEIPISEIKDFPDHPCQVRDDDSMTELVESVKERGFIQPVLVRPVDGGYRSCKCAEHGSRIHNSGKVLGQEVSDKTLREFSQAITDHIEPRIFPEIEAV